jgi:hypothetical protein
MTPEQATAYMREVWTKAIRESRGRPNLDELTQAKLREAYKLAPLDEQGRAYHAFARHGILLADSAPNVIGPVTFSIGNDYFRCKGYDGGARWNGFAVPLVTIDVVRELIVQLTTDLDDAGRYELRPDPHVPNPGPDDVVIIYIDEEGNESPGYPAEMFETSDGDLMLFDVGLGLCWHVDDDTDE